MYNYILIKKCLYIICRLHIFITKILRKRERERDQEENTDGRNYWYYGYLQDVRNYWQNSRVDSQSHEAGFNERHVPGDVRFRQSGGVAN